MRAQLSVIIPTLNAAESLPDCLLSLMEGVEAGVIRELIISDGGSVDATHRIAQEAGAEWILGAASRGGQLRRGIAAAKGTWLLIVHADCRLSAGWAEAVTNQMAGGHAAYFRLRFDIAGLAPRWVAGWANLRARLFGLPYGDQGLLISRTIYDAVGGYRDIPLMEDVAMARALRGRLVTMPLPITTSAEKYRRTGWIRRGAGNIWRLIRFLLGADPAHLARRY